MAWSKRGTSSTGFSATANFTVTRPAGTTTGDLVVVVMYQETDTAIATTPPAGEGFATLTSGENATSSPDTQYLAWYKIADSSEPASYTFTHNNVYRSAACLVLIPTSQPAVFDSQSSAVQTGSTTTLALTAITTLTASCAVVTAASNWNEEDATSVATGYTKEIEVVGGGGGGLAIAWKEQASAGTTGTVTWTFGATTESVGAIHAFKNTGAAPTSLPFFVPQRRIFTRRRLV
jgi:hypothetical protein